MTDNMDFLAEQPTPRRSTGFPLLDGVLRGGFPLGLTTIACEGRDALALVRQWSGQLERANDARLRVSVCDGATMDARTAHHLAMTEQSAVIRVDLAAKHGQERSREDLYASNVLLLVRVDGEDVTVAVRKNRYGDPASVRFTYSDSVLIERGVIPSPAP